MHCHAGTAIRAGDVTSSEGTDWHLSFCQSPIRAGVVIMFHRYWLRSALAGLLTVLLGAGITKAGPHTAAPVPPPPTASSVDTFDYTKARAQREALTPDRLPPLSSNREHLRQDRSQPAVAKAALACDATIFANASGAALVTAVKNSTVECIDALFSISGAQGALVFPEAKMVSIANAMAADAATYPGNNTGKMLQLVRFLRAGYYLQWYNPEVGDYGLPLINAIRPALDAFVANSHFQDVNDNHGEILADFVILIDSSRQNTSHIGTIKGILDRYDASYYAYWNMTSAVNGVFTVLFRGHYLDDFRAAVQVSPGSALIDSLVNFVSNNKASDIGSDREYLLQNAAAELARFLNPGPWYGYPTAFHDLVHPKAKGVLDQFSLGGYGSGVYVRMAGVIDYFDNAHCAYFGLCTFAQDLEDYILPAANARVCSPTLKVRSQALTSAQMDWVCDTIAQEEVFFHNKIGTNSGNPVANDFNAQLEMVIFHSSTDYVTYAGTIFGIDTNNGGMYLEGDPSVVGNQARFVAHEAEWLRPSFDVWNLTHEYVHYLDGRFIWYGMFGEYPMSAPYSGVWFFEGFGEYMSYTFRNLTYSAAVSEAANPDKFSFSQVLDTVYSTDVARRYQWGYMAVRFMFERHLADINAMITLTRQGNYDPGYHSWLDSIRNSYNAEFRAWVVCFHEGNGDTSACGGEVPPLPDPIFTDGFEGDGGTLPPDDLPECAEAANGRLDNDCKISGLSAPRAVDRVWLTVLVPSGTSSITLSTTAGSGDVDLYHKAGGWPSDTDFDQSSTHDGNEESISIQNPAQGWHYLMLKPKSDAFDAVEASAHWQ
jgi:microbial collagenase